MVADMTLVEAPEGLSTPNKTRLATSSPIFNYVHLSSGVLRKVRFGQPLDDALHKPQDLLQPVRRWRQQLANLQQRPPSPVSKARALSRGPKSGIYREIRPGPGTATHRTVAHPPRSVPKQQQNKSPGGSSAFHLLRYGRVVRFQAEDGGFLLVGPDSTLRKAPPEFRDDPRALLTLFPTDPRANPASKKRIRLGETLFIVQGATALYSRHGSVYADSHRLQPPCSWQSDPQHTAQVAPDTSAVGVVGVAAATQLPHKAKHGPSLRRSRSVAEPSPTSVWCLKKPTPRDQQQLASGENRARATTYSSPPTSDEHNFRSGATVLLVQSSMELCYNLETMAAPVTPRSELSPTTTSPANKTDRADPPGTSTAQSLRMAEEGFATHPEAAAPMHSDNQTAGRKKPLFDPVWLRCPSAGPATETQSLEASTWASLWVICDVELDKQREHEQLQRQRRLQARETLATIVSQAASAPSTLAAVASDQRHDVPPFTALGSKPRKLGTTHHVHECAGERTPTQHSKQKRSLPSRDVGNSVLDQTPRSFAAAAEERQHQAARIVARFLRSLRRCDGAADRAQEVFRQRWREKHPERYRSRLFSLSNDDQLRVLQLYNPHLYGSQLAVPPLATGSTSIRFLRVPQMVQQKRRAQQQRLARVGQETAMLKESCQQKVPTPASATVQLHEMYKRRPLTSPERPNKLLERERGHHTHLQLPLARSTAPSFHFGSAAQAPLRSSRSATEVLRHQPRIRSAPHHGHARA